MPRPPSAEAVVDRLSRIDLVRALPAEEIATLVPHVERLKVPAGARVITQGDAPDGLYLLDEGTVRIVADGAVELGRKGPGEVFGEMALLSGAPRAATVVAESDLTLWRVPRDAFEGVVSASPQLGAALRELARRHREGLQAARTDSLARGAWRGVALRTLAARNPSMPAWQRVMAFGIALWALLGLNEAARWLSPDELEIPLAIVQLVAGLTVIQGACEAFVLAVERLGARLRWDGFTSGTIGSLVATLPEFVVIAFLVVVEPLAGFVTAAVTIFNDALVFSVYSFFLPKDQRGRFLMPPSLARAGGEVLVAGSGIAMIVGAVMLAVSVGAHKTTLAGADLVMLGAVLLAIFGYYVYELVRYYSEKREEEHPLHPPEPGRLGHATGWRAIGSMLAVGVIGGFIGGEAVGSFADTALHRLELPTIPTAAALAFFASMSEYIIVWKAHRRGELGIALSNVFGGITQAMFLLLPFTLLATAVFGFVGGSATYAIPITLETTFLMLLLFPLFYVLLEYLREDHTLGNLDAAAMTGIYALLLYFLFTA